MSTLACKPNRTGSHNAWVCFQNKDIRTSHCSACIHAEEDMKCAVLSSPVGSGTELYSKDKRVQGWLFDGNAMG